MLDGAPTDRDAYKKFLADQKLLDRDARSPARRGLVPRGHRRQRQRRRSAMLVTYGGKRLVCCGSLYKDAESTALGGSARQGRHPPRRRSARPWRCSDRRSGYSAATRMSYLVLARKYRPSTFAEVVGQEHVTRTLATRSRAGRVHHAFLFCGPRGCGKTTVARIVGKALNCATVATDRRAVRRVRGVRQHRQRQRGRLPGDGRRVEPRHRCDPRADRGGALPARGAAARRSTSSTKSTCSRPRRSTRC